MHPLVRKVLEAIIVACTTALAPLFLLVAKSGIGVPTCRKLGFQPVLVHFYTPIPDYESIPTAQFTHRQNFPGVNLNLERSIASLIGMSPYASECKWPDNRIGQEAFYSLNPQFGFCSAALLHCMLRARKSTRVIEVGGGYSTAITLAALKELSDSNPSFICIEPFPSRFARDQILSLSSRLNCRLIERGVQTVPKESFLTLESNDVLFIDSSHVSKLGSDVNYLILEILPILKQGVLVHFHDIYLPYEYPAEHFFGRHKVFWNEQYLLAAFLTENPNFEVLVAGHHLLRNASAAFQQHFPQFDRDRHRSTSSFWIRRCK